MEIRLILAVWVVAGAVSPDGDAYDDVRAWPMINPWPIFDLEELGSLLDEMVSMRLLDELPDDQFRLRDDSLAIDCYDDHDVNQAKQSAPEWHVDVNNVNLYRGQFYHPPHIGMRYRVWRGPKRHEAEIQEVKTHCQTVVIEEVEPGGQRTSRTNM